jgi:hypothetical protein
VGVDRGGIEEIELPVGIGQRRQVRRLHDRRVLDIFLAETDEPFVDVAAVQRRLGAEHAFPTGQDPAAAAAEIENQANIGNTYAAVSQQFDDDLDGAAP